MAKPNKNPTHNASTALQNTPTVPTQGALDDKGRATQSIGGATFTATQKPFLIDTPAPSHAFPWQSDQENKNAYNPPIPPS